MPPPAHARRIKKSLITPETARRVKPSPERNSYVLQGCRKPGADLTGDGLPAAILQSLLSSKTAEKTRLPLAFGSQKNTPHLARCQTKTQYIVGPEGTCIQVHCEKGLGHSQGQPATPERHRIKIHDCLQRVFDAATEDEFVTLASRLHELSPTELKRLMEICRMDG